MCGYYAGRESHANDLFKAEKSGMRSVWTSLSECRLYAGVSPFSVLYTAMDIFIYSIRKIHRVLSLPCGAELPLNLQYKQIPPLRTTPQMICASGLGVNGASL